MKFYIILALSSIALISFGAVQTSFAFWPFDTPQNNNIVTVRQADSIITYDKTTNQGSWQSAPKWMQDYIDYQGNPVYVPYKIWDNPDYTTFENPQASITLDKNSCSLRVFDAGKVNSDAVALLNSVNFNLQYAKNGTDVWNESPENYDKCNIQYTKTSNGITANMIQGGSTQKNIEVQLYDNKTPELILKVTNNDQSNIDTKYGFAVLISNSSSTVIDGDLIRFQDSHNKTVLIFDTQNTIIHYLWTIKKINDGLILDYKNAKGPLAPGNTLQIDPTFTASPSPNIYIFKTAAGAGSCTTYSATTTHATQMQSFDLHAGSNGCGNSAAEFDITSFPRTAILSSVQLEGTISSGGSNPCNFVTEPNRPSTTAGATMYAQLQSATPYVNVPNCNIGSTKINLGTNAVNNFTASYTNNWFAVGLNVIPSTYSVALDSTQLLVNYTLPVPNAVTNLSCTPAQALGNLCFRTNSTSTGGKVQGFYVTRNSTSEPLFSNYLKGYWKMDGLSLSNKIEDYSSTKANGTVTGTFVNKTGQIAQAMNFSGSNYVTTSVSPYSWERTQPFSISFWIKTTDNSHSIEVLGNNQGGSITGKGWDIWLSGDLRFYITNTDLVNYMAVRSFPTIFDGAWHHIVMTYAGTSANTGVRMYKDTINQTISTLNTPISASSASASSLTIGAVPGGGGYFDGQLDEVRIYNKVLSHTEIGTLYNYRLNSAVSKTDSYLTRDGSNYQYCVYPVNQYGQNDTRTCANTFTANYATPPTTTGGKFYNPGAYTVQFGWTPQGKIGSDVFTTTGYKLQRYDGATFQTLASNTTVTQYTDSSLVNAASQKYKIQANNHLGTSPSFTFINTNTTGLIDLYQFDNNTMDSGTKTNTPTIKGLENYTAGNIGYALALDGNTTLKYTASGVPNGTSDRTVSMWVKMPSFSSNLNGYFSQGGTGANSFFGLLDANGKVECGGPSNNVNSSTTLTANKWSMISCVMSNSGKTKTIYINGTYDATTTTGTGITSTASNVYIGTRIDNTNKNVTGFIDNFRMYNTALTPAFMTELYNQQIRTVDNATISGTHTVSFTTVGDITRGTSTLTLTGGGFPSSLTIQNWHLYNYSSIYNNTNVSTGATPGVPVSFLYGNYFNVDVLHQFKAVARVSNGTGTTLVNSTLYNITYAYLPSYTTSSGVTWNYTTTRPAPSTNFTLLANENPILFDLHCQIQTATDAAAGKSNGWYNGTNIEFFLQSITVHNYDNIYGTCYTAGGAKLFTFVSYGNSSLFPAIAFMDQAYGAYVGVPVGVIFIVMAAALGNKRTAPMWVVIILAIAGIMSVVGFFTLNSGVWALALIAGLLALFVGRKLF